MFPNCPFADGLQIASSSHQLCSCLPLRLPRALVISDRRNCPCLTHFCVRCEQLHFRTTDANSKSALISETDVFMHSWRCPQNNLVKANCGLCVDFCFSFDAMSVLPVSARFLQPTLPSFAVIFLCNHQMQPRDFPRARATNFTAQLRGFAAQSRSMAFFLDLSR